MLPERSGELRSERDDPEDDQERPDRPEPRCEGQGYLEVSPALKVNWLNNSKSNSNFITSQINF